MTVRVRIAPSPTGHPHVGTAYIALINWCFARKHDGRFVLRIEDTDRGRARADSEAAIFAALSWLGLDHDEGPSIGGEHGPYRQSERVEAGIYRPFVDQLIAQGDAYPCFCTAEDLAAMRERQRREKSSIMYDGTHRDIDPAEAADRIAAGEPYVVRMKAPRDGEHVYRDRLRKQPIAKSWSEIDDQILVKSDGWPTYHLASVVDDHLMGISHVIRAEEWLNSLPKHTWLYERLGWRAPEFVHVGLLRNPDRSKISKRKNPTDVLHYKRCGFMPEAMINFLALLGHSHPDEREKFDLDELIRVFDLDRLNVGGPVFDQAKLEHLQGLYFRELEPPAMKAEIHRALDERLDELLPHFRPRMSFGGDITWRAGFVFAQEVKVRAEDLVGKKFDAEAARASLDATRSAFVKALKDDRFEWEEAAIEARLETLVEKHGFPRRPYFMCLRRAITGSSESPPIGATLALVGPHAVLDRLEAARRVLR